MQAGSESLVNEFESMTSLDSILGGVTPPPEELSPIKEIQNQLVLSFQHDEIVRSISSQFGVSPEYAESLVPIARRLLLAEVAELLAEIPKCREDEKREIEELIQAESALLTTANQTIRRLTRELEAINTGPGQTAEESERLAQMSTRFHTAELLRDGAIAAIRSLQKKLRKAEQR